MADKQKKRTISATKKFEAALAHPENAGRNGKEKYVLKLYITGMTARSQQALRNLKKVCRDYLGDAYELEVIDIYQQPTLAKGEQIVAAPTLIKKLPEPLRKFIGSMADKEKMLVGLDLQPKKGQ
jgi:circadian clock protein KaiB